MNMRLLLIAAQSIALLQGLHSVFERFRGILHEGEIDKRVQFMIEGVFAIRKAGELQLPSTSPCDHGMNDLETLHE